ncbi:hypothetical protein [Aurantiacibacter zhengii]|uniref:Uncharacterized protein n=1 Tax=Aurantiacibacter zhengii TaxID=2307003 RepID=A0A418NRH7_9SPHN|nr:hypothetical protein [Aurantiacibacter zhengii]RIV85192.1 hypothetical protein D2V07_13005 [Aurantiacibacter zhengii]
MSEAQYGKYRIVHGDVRLEDPTYGQVERNAYVAEVIELANFRLSEQGCDDLRPLQMVPARADDDYFHFLHIGSSNTAAGQNGAFHFGLQRRDPKLPPEEVAERLAQAATTYLSRRDEIVIQANEVFSEISQYEWPEGFIIHEVAALMDCSEKPRFSAELSMLEFDLVESRTRRTGHNVRSLLQNLERAAEMHERRLAALAEKLEAGCDLFIEETAKHLLDYYDLTVEKVLEVLNGTHWMDIYDERDDAKYTVATVHLQDGTLMADMRDGSSSWELRGDTFVLADSVSLPETVRHGLCGQPLSRLLRTGNMLEHLTIESLDSQEGETRYIELAIPKSAVVLEKGTRLSNAA